MSDRHVNAFINAAFVVAKTPGPPQYAAATRGTSNAEISFSYPTEYGVGSITGFRVTSTPGNITATGVSPPITVSGLTNNVTYSFQVTAINFFGESPGSNVTNAVTPSLLGQRLYTAGTFTFVVPAGITSVSVVCVGGGGASGYNAYTGGGGGGLRYKNNITVTPGQSITVVAAGQVSTGTNGGISSFGTDGTDAFYFFAGGGTTVYGGFATGAGGTGSTIGVAADGGGNGGASSTGMGGGGAGGYTGNGGNGGVNGAGSPGAGSGLNMTGGGGGGGAGWDPNIYAAPRFNGHGGGVGVLGQGSTGAGGEGTSSSANEPSKNGQGGSGGTTATSLADQTSGGGTYGGGGGGSVVFSNYGYGAAGAVRIIWPATGAITRSFPSTNTGDQ
jgi:hypothetical protein